MYLRASLFTSSLLAAALAMPARAESRYATTRFEISFGDGWQDQRGLVPGDSALSLMYGYSMMGFCYLTSSLAGQPASVRDFDAFRQQYIGSDSILPVAEGVDTLGGMAFTYFEFKNTDSANGDIRLRLYSTSNGSIRFNSVLAYEYANQSVLVPEMDSALATLTFSTTAIRARTPHSAVSTAMPGKAASRDVLGRFRTLALRSELFRLPQR